MSPETHLLASWIIAAKTTHNPRDCRLVTLAGILPDADGLGLAVDLASNLFGWRQTLLYERYHHYYLHGALGAILIAGTLACFARERGRVALLALLVFHLHLLCDFVGSRGPSPTDLWPIFYLGPFTRDPTWVWKGQWRLDGWFNRYLTVALFLWALWIPVHLGYSVVGVFSARADKAFVSVLRKWHEAWLRRRRAPG
ncbi:MAG TPA: metal-dependent hydrolase [Candidatus Acidoferrum sp.]|nr:metal-dependent hydrolase [Candidatus Acidoferrum sp.]